MIWGKFVVSSPVNAAAAKAAAGTWAEVTEINIEDLIYLLGRLERKQRLLKLRIGIKTKAQHKNLKLKINKGLRTYRQSLQPRIVDEYVANGDAIRNLQLRLQTLKAG